MEDSARSDNDHDDAEGEGRGLTKEERTRRVVQLCLYCLDNIACYRAGWQANAEGRRTLIVQRPFWTRVNGNFLDIAVLEWCKLFADKRGKHHFSRVVPDGKKFLDAMLDALKLTEEDFGRSTEAVRVYRDKFVAHLDDHRTMYLPVLELCRKSAIFLHDYLCSDEATRGHLVGLYPNASEFFTARLADAREEHRGGPKK